MKLEEGKILSNFDMPPNTRYIRLSIAFVWLSFVDYFKVYQFSFMIFRFTMRWTIRNNGDECWPHGCSLQYISGDHPCNVKAIPVRVLPPGLSTIIVVDFIAPSESGFYQSKWRMTTPFGAYFGGKFHNDRLVYIELFLQK